MSFCKQKEKQKLKLCFSGGFCELKVDVSPASNMPSF